MVILGIVIALFSAWVAFEDHQVNVSTNEASIDYYLTKTSNFFNYTGAENFITINCNNGGKMDGDFNLVLNFVNASFSTKTEQPYTEIKSTSAEFRWTLHEGNSASKNVYFDIDPSANSFSISLSINSNQGYLKTNPVYPLFLQYSWNQTFNYFQLTA